VIGKNGIVDSPEGLFEDGPDRFVTIWKQ